MAHGQRRRQRRDVDQNRGETKKSDIIITSTDMNGEFKIGAYDGYLTQFSCKLLLITGFLLAAFGGYVAFKLGIITTRFGSIASIDQKASTDSSLTKATMPKLNNNTTNENRVMFGFLPDYRFQAADVRFMIPRMTHLCLFGSEGDAHSGRLISRLPSKEKFGEIRSLAKTHGTKLYLGLGGAGRSDFFPKVLENEKKRTVFEKDIRQLIKEHEFEGVEVNWMYPSNIQAIEYLKHFVHGLSTHKIKVSMAIPPNEQFAKAIASIPFDMFHIMAYQQGITHRPPQAVQQVKSIVHKFSEIVPAGKLLFGVPFYGVKANGESVSYEDYANLKDDTLRSQISIEDGNILSAKRQLVHDAGWLGISIWELGQDCRPDQVGVHPKTCPNGEKDSLLASIV